MEENTSLTNAQLWVKSSVTYVTYLEGLFEKYNGVLSREEIYQACQKVMSHYGRPGLDTIHLLANNHFAVTRDFLREVGKLLPDG
jgi:hypothetical protein